MFRVIHNDLDHPEVAELSCAMREHFRAPWVHVLRRAIEKGEVPENIDIYLVIDAICSTVFARRFKFHETIQPAVIRRLISIVVDGISHGGGQLEEQGHSTTTNCENDQFVSILTTCKL
jgi:hypothetical protein